VLPGAKRDLALDKGGQVARPDMADRECGVALWQAGLRA
jgi:hypothetical protein